MDDSKTPDSLGVVVQIILSRLDQSDQLTRDLISSERAARQAVDDDHSKRLTAVEGATVALRGDIDALQTVNDTRKGAELTKAEADKRRNAWIGWIGGIGAAVASAGSAVAAFLWHAPPPNH